MTNENEQNCGQYLIKNLKPVTLENTMPKCNGCPLAKDLQTCFIMMYHSDNHCQKYLSKPK